MISIANQSVADSMLWLDSVPAIVCKVPDGGYVDVYVSIGSVSVYHDVLYAYSNKVEISVRSLLEEEFRMRNLCFSTVRVTFAQPQPVSLDFSVILRKGAFGVLVKDFTATNFLTFSAAKYLPLNMTDQVAFIQEAEETVTAKIDVLYLDKSGALATQNVYSSHWGNSTTPQYRSFTVQWYASELPVDAEPKAMVVTAGNRRLVYYRKDDCNHAFHFYNVFNVREYLYFRASVSAKRTTKASLGRVDSKLMRYDAETTEEFTAKFEPMIPDEVAMLSQLAESENPQWRDLSQPYWHNMVIESAEFTSDPVAEKLSTPELKFRLEQPRGGIIAQSPGRIHTDEFNESYN